MAKAVYRRYENATTVTYQRGGWGSENRTSCNDYVYSGWEFTEESGFQLTGSSHRFREGTKDDGYYLYGLNLVNVYTVKSYNADSYGTYSRVMPSTEVENHSRGSFLENAILDYGSVPTDSRAEDGYWYEFVRMVGMSVQAEGAFRDAEGFANESGVWKPQSEIRANVDGTYK